MFCIYDRNPIPGKQVHQQWMVLTMWNGVIRFRVHHRDHFVYAPSQWETLHCNSISHWLGAYTKWSLNHHYQRRHIHNGCCRCCCCWYDDVMLHDDVIKFSVLPTLCAGNNRSPVNSPHKGQWREVFGVFFDLHLNKRLSKQSWRRWFETSSCSLWRHCNGVVVVMKVVM